MSAKSIDPVKIAQWDISNGSIFLAFFKYVLSFNFIYVGSNMSAKSIDPVEIAQWDISDGSNLLAFVNILLTLSGEINKLAKSKDPVMIAQWEISSGSMHFAFVSILWNRFRYKPRCIDPNEMAHMGLYPSHNNVHNHVFFLFCFSSNCFVLSYS